MWRGNEATSELGKQHNKYVWWIMWPLVLILLARSCGGGGDQTGISETSDAVKGFGQSAIVAFVGSSPADTAGAESYYGPLVAPGRDGGGFPYPGETVLGVSARTPKDKGTLSDKSRSWLVIADVITDEGPQTWQQYVVVTEKNTFRVDGLPGFVPPEKLAPLDQIQSQQGGQGAQSCANTAAQSNSSTGQQGQGLTQDSPVCTTLKDFFNAWLTGNGDLTRVANDSVPTFVTPPFDTVEIESIKPSNNPDKIEGTITVATTVIATKIKSQKMFYNLTLTGASGRWVVTDASAAPAST